MTRYYLRTLATYAMAAVHSNGWWRQRRMSSLPARPRSQWFAWPESGGPVENEIVRPSAPVFVLPDEPAWQRRAMQPAPPLPRPAVAQGGPLPGDAGGPRDEGLPGPVISPNLQHQLPGGPPVTGIPMAGPTPTAPPPGPDPGMTIRRMDERGFLTPDVVVSRAEYEMLAMRAARFEIKNGRYVYLSDDRDFMDSRAPMLLIPRLNMDVAGDLVTNPVSIGVVDYRLAKVVGKRDDGMSVADVDPGTTTVRTLLGQHTFPPLPRSVDISVSLGSGRVEEFRVEAIDFDESLRRIVPWLGTAVVRACTVRPNVSAKESFSVPNELPDPVVMPPGAQPARRPSTGQVHWAPGV